MHVTNAWALLFVCISHPAGMGAQETPVFSAADLNFGTILQGGAPRPISIQLDENSALVSSGERRNFGRRMNIYGEYKVISALDGVFSAGWERLVCDNRDPSGAVPSDRHGGWRYLNIQPVALAPLIITRGTTPEDAR